MMKRWPKISLSWELIPYLIAVTLLGGSVSVLWIFFLLVIHESGHVLVALWLHVPLEEIRVHPYGLIAHSKHLDHTHSLKECLIALAGPLFQLIGQGCVMLGISWGWISTVQGQWLSKINESMLIFNLLPMMPLDGGRIVRGLLHVWYPYTCAERWSAISSLVVIFILVWLHPQQGIWFWAVCMGCFMQSLLTLRQLPQQRLVFYYDRYCHPSHDSPKYHHHTDLYRNHHNYLHIKQTIWEEQQWLARFFDPDKTV